MEEDFPPFHNVPASLEGAAAPGPKATTQRADISCGGAPPTEPSPGPAETGWEDSPKQSGNGALCRERSPVTPKSCCPSAQGKLRLGGKRDAHDPEGKAAAPGQAL